jgi:hypothetical protein
LIPCLFSPFNGLSGGHCAICRFLRNTFLQLHALRELNAIPVKVMNGKLMRQPVHKGGCDRLISKYGSPFGKSQIRKRPSKSGHQLHVAQDQRCAQRRLHLRLDYVGISSKKGFDLQILFDHHKKQFHLPLVPVNGCNRCSRELQVVGQECK